MMNWHWWVKRGGITLAVTILFYHLGRLLPYSGDGAYAEQLAKQGWVMLRHSTLTTLVHRAVYVCAKPLGFSAWEAVSLSSAIGGAIASQFLFAISRHPVFLAINIFSGSFLVFVGEVENYAWVNACLLGSIYCIERFINEECKLWPAMALYFCACFFHGLALFYLPAFLWILKRKQDFHPAEFLLPFIVYIAGMTACNVFLTSEGLDIDTGRLVPWFEIHRKGQLFLLFSSTHLDLLWHFHRSAAFFLFPVPLELPLLFALRKRIDTPFKTFLAIGCMIGLVWSTFWHPDLGRLDWDLFSQPGILIHLLLGLLLAEKFESCHWTMPTVYRNNTTGMDAGNATPPNREWCD